MIIKAFMIKQIVFLFLLSISGPSMQASDPAPQINRPGTPKGHINISTYDQISVLLVLYNAAKPYDLKKLTYDKSREFVNDSVAWHYSVKVSHVFGKDLDIIFNGQCLDPSGYDARYGAGAALKAINALALKKSQ